MDSNPQPSEVKKEASEPNQSLPKENNFVNNTSGEKLLTNKNMIQMCPASFVSSNQNAASSDMNGTSMPLQTQKSRKKGGRKHNRTLKKERRIAEFLENCPFVEKQNPLNDKVHVMWKPNKDVEVKIIMPSNFYRSLSIGSSLPHPCTNSNLFWAKKSINEICAASVNLSDVIPPSASESELETIQIRKRKHHRAGRKWNKSKKCLQSRQYCQEGNIPVTWQSTGMPFTNFNFNIQHSENPFVNYDSYQEGYYYWY